MTEETLFPEYIARQEEERQILLEAARVQDDGQSRTVLLYGPGGVGKTRLVRTLARVNVANETTAWLDPVDVDDSAYWLLSNLERNIVRQLDPDNRFFASYLEYLSRLPAQGRIGHETVVSYLGRIKQVFLECYKTFVAGSGKTVVLVFDTVETIRGTYLLLTLTQWMKELPATLFILSGRPMPHGGQDPIQHELENPYQPMPVTTIQLGEFTEQAAAEYLASSRIAAGLADEEKAKLVRLTRGHPLWLALTVAYLSEKGIPEEAETPLAVIEQHVPYRGDIGRAGRSLVEAFKRRLMTPYQDTEFWPEAVKRLAVVRQGVNQSIWQRLMADRPLPRGVANLDEAWVQLLGTPWIRPRSNRHFVTLHDAVAEELAQRIIPLHDQDQQWRRGLWRQAADVYRDQTEIPGARLADEMAVLDEKLEVLDERPWLGNERRTPSGEQGAFIHEAAELDARKRELDQFKVAYFHYQLLGDFTAGCQQFLDLFGQARHEHDVLFQDLLALAMQRFLPGSVDPHAFDDVVGGVIIEFRQWLSEQPQLYIAIGLSMADYMIANEQMETAIELLNRLPMSAGDHRQRYRSNILLGNAYLRTPGQVKKGLTNFQAALALAGEAELPSADRQRLIAEAHKELGFYYRNVGRWQEADRAYQQARDAISATLSARGSDEDRAEMASIQNNWAYVKGLGGYYRDGSNLIESAITVRQRLKKHLEEGISWSVCGEVYRYERRFQKAWDAYAEAERIFEEQRSWPWLGLIYQEQAICLFQAFQDGDNIHSQPDPVGRARQLVTQALIICLEQSIRAYPSALNRAGRIFGQDDFDAGLRYLAEGIEQARMLSDGWFWLANLIEYTELSYRAWVTTGRSEYREEIIRHEADFAQAASEYAFPDLQGRWRIIHGHLAIHEWEETRDGSRLSSALENYREGFGLIAQGGHVGSSGTSVIPGEFKTLASLFGRLPPDVRTEWQKDLRLAWSELEGGSTQLLARLEELY